MLLKESFLITIEDLKPNQIILCFDKQRSKSKEHSRLFENIFHQQDIKGSCLLLKAVDYHLKNLTDSIILSHDSIILKETKFSFDFFNWYIQEKNLLEKKEYPIISIYCDETRSESL